MWSLNPQLLEQPYLTGSLLYLSERLFTAVVISLQCLTVLLNGQTYFEHASCVPQGHPPGRQELRTGLVNAAHPLTVSTSGPHLYPRTPLNGKPRTSRFQSHR